MNSESSDKTRRSAPVSLEECGLAQAARLLGDKWTMLIIREAFYGVVRFQDMHTDLKIPRAILTSRLEKLLEADVLSRHPYQEEGKRQRYDYRLTPSGRRLSLTLLAMMQWGDDHLKGGEVSLGLTDRQTGERLRVGLIDEQGRAVSFRNLEITIPESKSEERKK